MIYVFMEGVSWIDDIRHLKPCAGFSSWKKKPDLERQVIVGT
jgi:hypothetical protein